MPETDPPAVSYRKALKNLGAAQRYAIRAGDGELAEAILALKAIAASNAPMDPTPDRRCSVCQNGRHWECKGCGCLNGQHRGPVTE